MAYRHSRMKPGSHLLQESGVCEHLQQFRVIRDHLNSKCLTSIIVFDIHVRSSI